jgi:ABC-type sugar transport system permease subunit
MARNERNESEKGRRAADVVVSRRERAGYYLFLLPSMIVFIVFIFAPAVWSFLLSLSDYSILTAAAPEFTGFRNYLLLFRNPLFLPALRNTFVFAVFDVPLTMLAGLILAVLISGRLVRRPAVFKVCFFIPYITSIVAVSIIFTLVFSPLPDGIANRVLLYFGQSAAGWIADSHMAMGVIVFLCIWKDCGYVMLIYTGAITSVSADIMDAARLEPMNDWQRMARIILPQIRPTTAFLVLTETIGAFQLYTPVKVMTDGGPGNATETLVTLLYSKGFSEYKMGLAGAIACILFAILTVFTLIGNRVLEHEAKD